MKYTLKHFVAYVLPYGILFIAIYSILPYPSSNLPYLTYLHVTVIWWIIIFSFLALFFLSNKYFLDERNKKNLLVINLYLFWMVICILRGAFVAELYWDWKGLVNNSMALLLPITVYSTTNKVVVQSILSKYIKYGLPLFMILMLLIRTDSFGFFLMPISFLLLFLPALSFKQRLILLFFTAIVFGADLGARSNVIKFGFPFFILLIYYFKEKLSVKFLEGIRILLIIAPFVFLTLAVTGVFNVFNVGEYLGEFQATGMDDEGDRNKINVTADTRTFLYVEVLQSAINNDYIFFGRTPARGNDSDNFGPLAYEFTGRDERLENEVGILNVFTWTGVLGIILYLLIFYRASFLAINRSKNIYAKMLGLFVAFRWLYSWVEDVNNFSLNYFILWVLIGLCFSHSFRMMNNNEVTIWIRGVFDNRYLNYEKYREKEDNGK